MKNKLALCSHGQLGLITHDKRQPVTYVDHSVGMAYVGIHLTDGPGRKIGDPWSARNPVIVGELCSSPAVMPVTGFGLVSDVTSYDVPVKNE
jgi:hypothetical protein